MKQKDVAAAGRVSTRTALVEKAEELFAQHGIDAVSLRQIGAAVGSANTNVVGYHFGDKDALIESVFGHRVSALEEQRATLLKELDELKRPQGLFELLRVLWLPLFEQVNEAGLHSYAGFLGELIRSGRGEVRRAFGSEFRATNEVIQRIRALAPSEAAALNEGRWRLAVLLVTEGLRMIDQQPALRPKEKCRIFDDVLRMSAAAILAGCA